MEVYVWILAKVDVSNLTRKGDVLQGNGRVVLAAEGSGVVDAVEYEAVVLDSGVLVVVVVRTVVDDVLILKSIVNLDGYLNSGGQILANDIGTPVALNRHSTKARADAKYVAIACQEVELHLVSRAGSIGQDVVHCQIYILFLNAIVVNVGEQFLSRNIGSVELYISKIGIDRENNILVVVIVVAVVDGIIVVVIVVAVVDGRIVVVAVVDVIVVVDVVVYKLIILRVADNSAIVEVESGGNILYLDSRLSNLNAKLLCQLNIIGVATQVNLCKGAAQSDRLRLTIVGRDISKAEEGITTLVVAQTAVINSQLHILGYGVGVAVAVLCPEHGAVGMTLGYGKRNFVAAEQIFQVLLNTLLYDDVAIFVEESVDKFIDALAVANGTSVQPTFEVQV